MGEVKKCYCDMCKAEYTPATYSNAGGGSGIVRQRIAVWKESGEPLDAVEADLCDSCFGKVKTWLVGKIKTAATDWKVDEPTVRNVSYPGV